MRTDALYLGSGPQEKTTLVHVIELLGCVANGTRVVGRTSAPSSAWVSFALTVVLLAATALWGRRGPRAIQHFESGARTEHKTDRARVRRH